MLGCCPERRPRSLRGADEGDVQMEYCTVGAGNPGEVVIKIFLSGPVFPVNGGNIICSAPPWYYLNGPFHRIPFRRRTAGLIIPPPREAVNVPICRDWGCRLYMIWNLSAQRADAHSAAEKVQKPPRFISVNLPWNRLSSASRGKQRLLPHIA